VATRYDTTTLSKEKSQRTPEGYLFCESYFARDGILEYRLPGGEVRRELRLPEINKAEDTLLSYASKPVTVEHPPVLLDAETSKQYQVGVSDPEAIYERRYGKGFVSGIVRIFDSTAIDLVDSGSKREISIGYTADIDRTSGVYFPSTGKYVTGEAAKKTKGGERFDAIQRNVKVNHIALTAKGRAGGDVRLRLDSEEDVGYQVGSIFSTKAASKLGKQIMTTIRLDNMDFEDVPEGFAMMANQKFKELENLQLRTDSLGKAIADRDTEIANLRASLEQQTQLRERERGRADALEIQLEEIKWDKSAEPDEDNEGDDEEEEESDAEKEMEEKMPFKKGKKSKKMMKKDADEDEDEDEDDTEDEEEEEEDDEERGDSMNDRLSAWMDAEAYIPGICRSDSYDPEMPVPDIQALVIQTFEPEVNLDSASPAYIQGRYDYWISQQGETKRDSYTDELRAVTGMAQRSDRSGINSVYREHNKEVMNNYTQRLALSKE
jgi:uncharacterized protein